MDWEIEVEYKDDWWQFDSSVPMKGSLVPDESIRIYVEIDRKWRAPGEYWGTYLVRGEGVGYKYSKRVYLIMQVGDSLDSGPIIQNITTNTGDLRDVVEIRFDKFIDSSYGDSLSLFTIEPYVQINEVEIDRNKIRLHTASHKLNVDYRIKIKWIEDVLGKISKDIEASYQFIDYSAGPDIDRSGSDRWYEWDAALPDKPVYTDRSFWIRSVPEILEGAAMLHTSGTDVTNSRLSLSFPVNHDNTEIFLAVDPERSGEWKSDWIEDEFELISERLPIYREDNNYSLKLYKSKKRYNTGEIVELSKNGANSDDSFMYLVFAKAWQPNLEISGQVIYYGNQQPVPNTQILMSGDNQAETTSDANGRYSFTELDENLNLEIRSQKTGDVDRFSILMHDASLAARISSGRLTNVSENQKMAADVNLDGEVTFGDAQNIAKFVVGMNPANDAHVAEWKFEKNSISFENLLESYSGQNFVAILIGDVDGNWAPYYQAIKKESNLVLAPEQNYLEFTLLSEKSDEPVYSFQLIIDTKNMNPETIAASFEGSVKGFQLFSQKLENGEFFIGGFGEDPLPVNGLIKVCFDNAPTTQLSSEISVKSYFVNGNPAIFTMSPVENQTSEQQHQFNLFQNYPNPFNPATMIRYQLSNAQPVRTVVRIFNMNGQCVRVLSDKTQSSGYYEIHWDGKDATFQEVASGIYFVSIQSGKYFDFRKMIKIK